MAEIRIDDGSLTINVYDGRRLVSSCKLRVKLNKRTDIIVKQKPKRKQKTTFRAKIPQHGWTNIQRGP